MSINTSTAADRKPLISLSIPVLNEQDNLHALYERLCALGEKMADRCDLEFVFSDNHSSDATWATLEALARQDSRIRAIRFSKNFGFQRSILANYMHTRGDAIMQIDADLQDPPELLENFFSLWKDGYHVVYGVRKKRQESAFLNGVRKLGYWFIDLVSDHSIPRDAGDFRLIDRRVVQALLQIKTASPYLRGMIASLGFNQIGVDYERDARTAGQSKFGLSRILQLGMTAVLNHSAVPLRLASAAGVTMLLFSMLGALYYFVLRLMHPDLPRGLASIHILVLFGIGLQSLLLGIVGEYLLRIYLILRGEPVAIVENSLNFAHDDLKL